MTKPEKKTTQLPGLEVVGRGIFLRPYQAYELKDILFIQQNHQACYFKETEQTYSIPAGYEVNDSPPMPPKQAFNQTIVEESRERLDKQMNLDANVAGSNALFTVDASGSMSNHQNSSEENYYAQRVSFIPLWSVYIPNVTNIDDKKMELNIPTPFKHANRKEYEKFFERYGTHYVRRAWVGGKSTLVLTVAKSSSMTKEEIKSSIQASYAGTKGGVTTDNKSDNEKLKNNCECTVFGKGGDELKLATLSSLDIEAYNNWLFSIKENPQVIELEVMGIWTLIDDEEKAKALKDAYKAATTFTPISAIFDYNNEINFIRGSKYCKYDIEKGETEKSKPMKEKWPALVEVGFDRIDAAFKGSDWSFEGGENMDSKLFVFRRNKYVCLDLKSNKVEKGYPKLIKDGWPGLSFDKIDAALNAGQDSIYFFAGSYYVRYNILKNRTDEGYPELISKRWAGVTFDRIDAAIYWGNSKVFFFRDDLHIRFDTITYNTDPGYPRPIVGSYVDDWKFFE